MVIDLNGTSLELLPQKTAYQPDTKTLLLADLHLGKASHFRKAGIPLSTKGTSKDYETLQALMELKQPNRVLLLGDLFHSDYNQEWETFKQFISNHPAIKFVLVKGNHDVMPVLQYQIPNFTVVDKQLIEGNIIYTHIPLAAVPDGFSNIAGHVHPGLLMRGLGRQTAKAPCFYYHQQLLLLPAFGHLTGLKAMDLRKGAKVYAVLPDRVMEMY